jgi:hypothetical protein
MRLFLLIVLLAFAGRAAQGQTDSLTTDRLPTPLLHVKGRILMFVNGMGIEYFPARRHSVELYGVASFYTGTPSIDHTREGALIGAYRYYLEPAIGAKWVRWWYLSPFLKHTRLSYGTGYLNDGDTYRHRGIRWCPGFVVGRQVQKRPALSGLVEWFIGPQFVMARDLERTYLGNGSVDGRWVNRRFWTIRAGIDFGIVSYRKR